MAPGGLAGPGKELMDEPIYERFDTADGFHAAVDHLLEQPGRELRIFDPEATALPLNESPRIATLERFLLASPTQRIHPVPHGTEPLTPHCPRMIAPLG